MGERPQYPSRGRAATWRPLDSGRGLDTAWCLPRSCNVGSREHHGSAYQEPRFLDAVDPAVALVSVGRDNDYGHPNASLIARLRRAGARVLRTDQSGDLAAVASGHGLSVVARGSPPT